MLIHNLSVTPYGYGDIPDLETKTGIPVGSKLDFPELEWTLFWYGLVTEPSPYQNRYTWSPFWNSHHQINMGIHVYASAHIKMVITILIWGFNIHHFETGIPISKWLSWCYKSRLQYGDFRPVYLYQNGDHHIDMGIQHSQFRNRDPYFKMGMVVLTIPILI